MARSEEEKLISRKRVNGLILFVDILLVGYLAYTIINYFISQGGEKKV